MPLLCAQDIEKLLALFEAGEENQKTASKRIDSLAVFSSRFRSPRPLHVKSE